MANTVRQSSDLRYSNPAFGLFWIISELRSWVTFLHYFTFYAVDIHDIRLLAPYDHFEIWRSLGPKWRDKLLCNLNLNQPNLQISWTSLALCGKLFALEVFLIQNKSGLYFLYFSYLANVFPRVFLNSAQVGLTSASQWTSTTLRCLTGENCSGSYHSPFYLLIISSSPYNFMN